MAHSVVSLAATSTLLHTTHPLRPIFLTIDLSGGVLFHVCVHVQMMGGVMTGEVILRRPPNPNQRQRRRRARKRTTTVGAMLTGN
jgi:hypothetical protein